MSSSKHNGISLWGEIRESFAMAMNALTSHKLRSALTLLGVLIGVFSIIVTMTAMRVLQNRAISNLQQLGSSTFAVQKWPQVQFGMERDWQKYWRRKNITRVNAQKVQDKATFVESMGMEREFWGGQIESRFQKSAPGVSLLGESPGSFPAHNWAMEEGRAISDMDVDNARNVCVLGSGLATSLFPFGSPIGDRIKINGTPYAIIGVIEAKGGSLGGNQDNFAVIPISTGLNEYGMWGASLTLLVQARDAGSLEDCQEEVRGILRVARKVPPGDPDDFELYSNDSLVEQFNTFTRSMRIGAAVVSSIALLAAGIGIMNIMLVSVTERTREIGVRRAIGARKRNIMVQFIMEAVVLCEVGGIIGVILGILGGNGVALYVKAPPAIPVDWIFIGLFICSIVGIVFGTYPAYKAANLDPIDSLRYE